MVISAPFLVGFGSPQKNILVGPGPLGFGAMPDTCHRKCAPSCPLVAEPAPSRARSVSFTLPDLAMVFAGDNFSQLTASNSCSVQVLIFGSRLSLSGPLSVTPHFSSGSPAFAVPQPMIRPVATVNAAKVGRAVNDRDRTMASLLDAQLGSSGLRHS